MNRRSRRPITLIRMSSRAEQKAQARAAREAAERDAERSDQRRRRVLVFGGVATAAIVIVLVAVLVSRSGGERVTPPAERASLLDSIPQEGPWLGAPDAPVVVEEYADLQCPFCAQFSTGDLPGLIRDEVRPGQVRMRLRLVSILGPDSEKAARFAAAAQLQNRLWQFAEAFYSAQGEEGSGYVTDAFLRERATEAGLDVDRAFADQSSAAARRIVAADQAAYDRAQLQGTPSFLVGPRGGDRTAADATQLRDAIDAAAAAAP
jgi:protein-disulfide isomerase